MVSNLNSHKYFKQSSVIVEKVRGLFLSIHNDTGQHLCVHVNPAARSVKYLRIISFRSRHKNRHLMKSLPCVLSNSWGCLECSRGQAHLRAAQHQGTTTSSTPVTAIRVLQPNPIFIGGGAAPLMMAHRKIYSKRDCLALLVILARR